LKVLNLFANSISGEIPGTLRFLTSLQVVDLQHNILAGDAFPVSGLPTSLNSYKVGGNQLRGTIPAYIEDIKGLKELWIGDNQVTGALPSNLGNLLDLESLYVNDNRMGGALPSELARVASLRQLWLSNNQFDNTIPEGYWYLADLEVLRLGNNFFSGSISTWIGLMTNLQDLNVNNNRLAGNVPTQLGLLTDLGTFHCTKLTSGTNMYFNNFVLSSLVFLSTITVELHFGGNLWSGNVPNIYSNLRQLETFDISNSNMRGSIPNSLFNLANLETAYFTGSKVAGSIPRSFSNSRNLRVLHIDDCPGIEGTIPNVAPGKLTKLKEFLVQGTTLTGSMPSTICQLRTTNKLNTLEADCNSSGGLECSYPDCCTECYPLISF
jgi:Leucine-rich repeat (LRR) protein